MSDNPIKPPIQVCRVGTRYGVLINGNVGRTYDTLNEAIKAAYEERKADNTL